MKGHFPLISALVAALLLIAGCFGGGDSAQRAEDNSEPTAAATQALEPTAAATEEPTAAATAEADTSDAESTEVDSADASSEEAAAADDASGEDDADSEADTATDASDDSSEAVAGDASGVVPVEEAPGINSYRMHVTVNSTTARGEDYVEIDGAFVKEPRAEQFLISIADGDEMQEIEVVTVDGVYYTRIGETWMQSPEGTIRSFAEVTLLTPQNIAGIISEMEVIGTEEINGVNATHYRGSKEIIPVVGTAGDTLDVSRVETAQLDLWADETHNAIIKLTLEASNSEPEMSARIDFEYTDFNSEITIEAPETLPAAAPPTADEDFEPRNELGALLGFNLLFPTGSTVEMVVGTNLYVVVGPYSLEEATNMIELNMEANGYSQLSKNEAPSGEVVYLYQQGEKAVSITLSDAGDGNTRFQFASGQ